MANNNNDLVFYQQWAAAGQQIDKYSMQPWCVDSENLDIFSDSQSVRSTAWSEPVEVENNDWVDVDERWRFKLAANGNVYDSLNDEWIDHSFFDTNAQKVDYQDWQWSNKAVYWTPLKLFVAYEWDQWRTITVITDRTWHTRYNDWVKNTISYTDTNSAVSSVDLHWDNSYITVVCASSSSFAGIRIHWSSMTWLMKLAIDTRWSTLEYWKINITNHNVKWDEASKSFKLDWNSWTSTVEFTENFTYEWFADAWGWDYWQNFYFQTKLANTVYRYDVEMYIKEKWDYMLPWEKNFVKIDWKWYMFYWDTYEEIETIKQYDIAGNSYYTVVTVWSFTVIEWQEIVALTKTMDYRLVFVNNEQDEIWIVYYIPAWDDILNFQQWWEFPWLKFINAVMVNGYSYVIAEERGIRWLYIFYNWQTKKIVWADTKYTESESLINWKEIYNFTWPMVNWRGKVVAPTINWLYMYWENKLWQNVGSFIFKVDWEITEMIAQNNELKITYTQWNKSYYTIYQDDVNIKNYMSEFSVTYPVQISSHLVEKEPLSLALSYNLPNADTKLEAYISVNDNYFWSFLTDWEVTPEEWAKYKVSWLSWDYWLNFVEKKWNWLTFYLSGDLPYQTSNTKNLVSEDTEQTIAFTDFNHFKYLWEAKKTDPEEIDWKHTYLNLTTKNDLPIVRKAQVKIIWITDNHTTPEIYWIRLLSQQFDK